MKQVLCSVCGEGFTETGTSFNGNPVYIKCYHLLEKYELLAQEKVPVKYYASLCNLLTEKNAEISNLKELLQAQRELIELQNMWVHMPAEKYIIAHELRNKIKSLESK